MNVALRFACAVLCAALFLAPALAQDKEKDVFNYVAQKAAGKDVKKIVFIADVRTHGGKGNHEFKPGALYMARTLNAQYPNVYAVVHPYHPKTGMPKDISHADCFVVLFNDGGPVAEDPDIKKAVENGAGFMAIHYSVEVNKGKQGDNFLKWMGGFFEANWSVNPFWVAKFDKIPEHETTRGVKPFEIRDEWYYHMRFVDGMKGVTPILSALPELKTLQGDGTKSSARGGNPAVFDEVKAGKPQVVAWAYVRPDGGRGFGFTGYHNYSNLTNDSFRTLLLNAAAWTAKLEVPSQGIYTKTPTTKEMDQWYEDGLRMMPK
jgi:hypothetical protein